MENKVLEVTYGLHQIAEVAARVSGLIHSNIILIYGEMGAGKTTFVKALCRALGVIDEVSSPTFALINEYQTTLGQPVYHFDFYRINDQDEALDIGIDEFFDSGHLCLIEWPERITNLLPAQTETILIEMAGEQRVLKFFAER